VTLDGQFCREALLQALRYGARPEIFNTDQGVQFTSTRVLPIQATFCRCNSFPWSSLRFLR
jgi:transposase InsO family protein